MGVLALEGAVIRRATARMVVRVVTRMPTGRVMTPHAWLLFLLHCHHRL
jgi:hypothetical protein